MAKKKAQSLIIKGTALWAKLFEPDTKFNPEGVYSIKIVAPADDPKTLEIIEKLEAARTVEYNAAIEEKPARKKLLSESPVFEDEYHHETGEETGNVIFHAKLKAVVTRKDKTTFEQAPVVVDAKVKALSPKVNVGNGSTVKVNVELIPYMMQSTKSVGVSLRLKAVQVIDLVEFGNDSASVFDEEDGYEDEGSAATSGFNDNEGTDDGGDDEDF